MTMPDVDRPKEVAVLRVANARRSPAAFAGLIATTLSMLVALSFAIGLVLREQTRHLREARPAEPLEGPGPNNVSLADIESLLVAHPDDPVARLTAAELALEQPLPQAERALEHLARFRSDDPALRARA